MQITTIIRFKRRAPAKMTTPLCELAAKYGTNKADLDYTPAYYKVLQAYTPKVLLELGIGAPGLSGGPSEHGASLYMWQEALPDAKIVGVDFRRELLFETGNIVTEWADCYQPDSIAAVGEEHGPFDMIVDDAVHDPDIQLSCLESLWPYLADGGFYGIEDLCPYKFPDGDWDWFLDQVVQIAGECKFEVSGQHAEKVIVIRKGLEPWESESSS